MAEGRKPKCYKCREKGHIRGKCELPKEAIPPEEASTPTVKTTPAAKTSPFPPATKQLERTSSEDKAAAKEAKKTDWITVGPQNKKEKMKRPLPRPTNRYGHRPTTKNHTLTQDHKHVCIHHQKYKSHTNTLSIIIKYASTSLP